MASHGDREFPLARLFIYNMADSDNGTASSRDSALTGGHLDRSSPPGERVRATSITVVNGIYAMSHTG